MATVARDMIDPLESHGRCSGHGLILPFNYLTYNYYNSFRGWGQGLFEWTEANAVDHLIQVRLLSVTLPTGGMVRK